jgi:DUF1680 family protein
VTPDITRRDALALLGLGSLAGLIPRDLYALRAVPRALPFDLRDVRLLDGPLRAAQQRNARYLLSLDPDRMLHNFSVNAGLAPKAPVYGGWESVEPWVSIRCHGHTTGHYLSAVAMMFASTGDAEFGRRATYMVSELRACQRARGDGLVCAFPDGSKPLDDAIAGRPFPGVPWYTMHKIFAGAPRRAPPCRDARRAGDARDLAEWTERSTRDMSDVQMQKMLDTEHGGMTEVLADVSALAKEPKYLALARRFAHQKVLMPLAEGRMFSTACTRTRRSRSSSDSSVFTSWKATRRTGAAARFFWKTIT